MKNKSSLEFPIKQSPDEVKMVPSNEEDALFDLVPDIEQPDRKVTPTASSLGSLAVDAVEQPPTDEHDEAPNAFEELGYSRLFKEPDVPSREARDALKAAGIDTEKMQADEARKEAQRYYENEFGLTGDVKLTPEQRRLAREYNDEFKWQGLQDKVKRGELTQAEADAKYRKHLRDHDRGPNNT